MRVVLAVVLGIASGACKSDRAGPAPPVAGGSSAGVTWDRSDGALRVRSPWVEVRWSEGTGSVIGLRDARTGAEYLDGLPGRAFTAVVDAGTGDLWSARGASVTSGDATLRAIDVRADAAGVVVDVAFDGVGSDAVHVVQHARLSGSDPLVRWTTDVTIDAGAAATVVSLVSPAITGVLERANETLAWPWHAGVLIAQPSSAARRVIYPAPASMPWMHLYDDRGGVMLAAFDPSGSYKQLHFGADDAIVPRLDPQRRAMAIETYPYLAPGPASGGAWTTPEIALGLSEGSAAGKETAWTWAADWYRAWLVTSGSARTPTAFVQHLHGWRSAADKTTARAYTYCDLPTRLLPAHFGAQTGIDAAFLYGWHRDGLDTYYPDFDFFSDAAPCLARADLKDAMSALHDADHGESVFFYLNARLVDEASRWFSLGGDNARSMARAQDGAKYVESYTNRDFDVVCPGSPAWRAQMVAKAGELRAIAPPPARGADGIWWDQLMEAPARLCFDRSHGHATPASAFPEGYRALLTDARAAFDGAGGAPDDRPYLFAAEGIVDVYAKWIDVAGLMWNRPLGYSAPHPCDAIDPGEGWPCGDGVQDAPAIARYTIPTKMLGIPGVGLARGSKDEMARAFLMGNPLKIPAYPAKVNTFAFPRYPRVYDAEPTIYFEGTYEDVKGLTLVPASPVRGSVIVGSARDRVGVQLWNPSADDAVVVVTIDPSRLGLPLGAATAVSDVEGGAIDWTAAPAGASFTVAVPAHDVKALRVTLSASRL